MRKLINATIIIIIGFLYMTGYSQKSEGFITSPNGLVYKIYHVAKDTAKPGIGDWASIDIRQVYKDSLVFDSKTQRGGQPVHFKIPQPEFKGDLMEGVVKMSAGDSGIFMVSVDSLFKNGQRPPQCDSNTAFTFYVRLISFDSPESLRLKEIENIKQYLIENKITVQPDSSGLYIIPLAPGNGIAIDSGSKVMCNLNLTYINGISIFAKDSFEIIIGSRNELPGFITNGIKMMQLGEKAKFLAPSKLAFGEKGYRDIPPYTPFLYTVEVLKVKSKGEVAKELAEQKLKEQMQIEAIKKEETMALEKYLKDNKITEKPTASGLYYIEKTKGTGLQPTPGKRVKVHYTGTLLNGKKFDSSRDRNEPLAFTLGKGQVIKGWEEGIAMMKQGGKAILIVPSQLGYGERDMGDIPPYSTLVFDVELLEISDVNPQVH